MSPSEETGSGSARQNQQERMMEAGLAKPGVAEALRVYGDAKRSGGAVGPLRRSTRLMFAAGADDESAV